MFVCVCRAVSDARVGQVIDEGAKTVDEVTRACEAGGDCGACREQIQQMIDDRTVVPASKLVREKAA
jgi:bacterioferritin-associated ferredoxin